MMMYRMNLVRSIRVAEQQTAQHTSRLLLMLAICFGILLLCGLSTMVRMSSMKRVNTNEVRRIAALRTELENYERMRRQEDANVVIDKADIELLNTLLADRVYWTRVLQSMATHLPDEDPISYWITKFAYRENTKTLTVGGFGYITDEQEQLLALDEYLNLLRADTNFSNVFSTTFLRSVERNDETVGSSGRGVSRERVNFEYNSMRRGTRRR
ncbi:MAG: hypothetical protein LBU70_02495 [Chitinispirillales bacterium]|jgi:Tfp pilus assembly protein PilN|nr:hypothetical protein [Chitinispirillales bacterium]